MTPQLPPSQRTRADAEQRRQTVWQLRVLGATWEHAAQVAGYADVRSARRAVRRWRQEMPQADVEEARDLAMQRGELLWMEAWKEVKAGKPGAVGAALRVLQRQAALMGVDAPTDTQPAAVVQLLQVLATAGHGQLGLPGDVWQLPRAAEPERHEHDGGDEQSSTGRDDDR